MSHQKNQASNPKTAEEAQALWDHNHELIEPRVPMDFVEIEICCYGSDALLSYLNKHSKKAGRLFNNILLAYMLREEVAANEGKATREMVKHFESVLPKILRDMKKVGADW